MLKNYTIDGFLTIYQQISKNFQKTLAKLKIFAIITAHNGKRNYPDGWYKMTLASHLSLKFGEVGEWLKPVPC